MGRMRQFWRDVGPRWQRIGAWLVLEPHWVATKAVMSSKGRQSCGERSEELSRAGRAIYDTANIYYEYDAKSLRCASVRQV